MARTGRNAPLTPARRNAQSAVVARRAAEAVARRQSDPNRMRGALFDMIEGATGSPQTASAASGLMDFLPGVGDASGFEDAWQAGKGGQYGTAAALGGLGLLGLIPGAGDALAAGGKALLRGAPDAARGAAPAARAIDTADLPPGSDPRYTGAAPNRTTPYERYNPSKVPARVARLTGILDDPNNPIHDIVNDHIAKGQTLQGSDWYNTEELRDWFVDELGPDVGDARWREYVNAVGHTSTGSNVPSNIRNASFYYMLDPDQRHAVASIVEKGGKTPRQAAESLGIEVPNMPEKYGYGHKMQSNQGANVKNALEGQWEQSVPDDLTGAARTKYLQANPKVKGFGNNLLGDDTNIAADKHFMRILAMSDGSPDFLSRKAELSAANREKLTAIYGDKLDPFTKTRMVNGKPHVEVNLGAAVDAGVITDTEAFKDVPTAWEDTPKATEYGAVEGAAQRLAEKYGMTPAQFQANLWMGAGDVTGLADESQGTFMELLRRAADKRAGERGVTRKEQLLDLIHKRAPLAIPAMIGTGGLMGMVAGEDENGGI